MKVSIRHRASVMHVSSVMGLPPCGCFQVQEKFESVVSSPPIDLYQIYLGVISTHHQVIMPFGSYINRLAVIVCTCARSTDTKLPILCVIY